MLLNQRVKNGMMIALLKGIRGKEAGYFGVVSLH